MFFTPSQPQKGHIRVTQNVFLPQVQILIHYLIHIPPLEIWRNLKKMNLNELGRHKLGTCRYGSPVGRHSIQIYILTYYSLRKREPLIALGSHQGGGDGGGLISALPWISASTVPNLWAGNRNSLRCSDIGQPYKGQLLQQCHAYPIINNNYNLTIIPDVHGMSYHRERIVWIVTFALQLLLPSGIAFLSPSHLILPLRVSSVSWMNEWMKI